MREASKIIQTFLQLPSNKQLRAVSGTLLDWTQCSRHFSHPHQKYPIDPDLTLLTPCYLTN